MLRLRNNAVWLVAVIIFIGGTASEAVSKEKDPTGANFIACNQWCVAHNKTRKSLAKCYLQCNAYWDTSGYDKNPR